MPDVLLQQVIANWQHAQINLLLKQSPTRSATTDTVVPHCRRSIRTQDFVVRTPPSFDELYGGINRLVAARLVKTKRGYFHATELASHLFLTAKQTAKKSMYDQLQAFTRLVLCPCCGAKLKRVTWRVQITEEQFSSAMRNYRAS
jgi:hypothetical protein